MLDPKKFEDLTKESVLKNRSALELFAYYIPQFVEPGKRFCSDLRKDTTPSCVVYDYGMYIDFGTKEKHDIFSYLQAKYSCSFPEVLQIINNDFNLNLGDKPVTTPVFFGVKPRKEVEIKFKQINWTDKALLYFNQGAITLEILEQYWFKQISGFWVDGRYFAVPPTQMCFAQSEIRKGQWVHKIYMPERPKGQRFPVSNDGGAIYGLRQLPETGDLLFLTSSRKDVACLRGLDYWGISGTSESVNFSKDLIDHLKTRFKRIVVFYDNDQRGRSAAEVLHGSHGLSGIITTPSESVKDPFACCSCFGKEATKLCIENELRNIW